MTVHLPGIALLSITPPPIASEAPLRLLDSRPELSHAADAGSILASLKGLDASWSALVPRDVGVPTLATGIVLGLLVVFLALPLYRRLWLAVRPREIVGRKRSDSL